VWAFVVGVATLASIPASVAYVLSQHVLELVAGGR
jgi:hypothetical protein